MRLSVKSAVSCAITHHPGETARPSPSVEGLTTQEEPAEPIQAQTQTDKAALSTTAVLGISPEVQAAPRHNATNTLSLSNPFGVLQQLNEGSNSLPDTSSSCPGRGKKKGNPGTGLTLPAASGAQHQLGTKGETINKSCPGVPSSKAAKKNAARSKRRAAAKLNKAHQAVVHDDEGSVDLAGAGDDDEAPGTMQQRQRTS